MDKQRLKLEHDGLISAVVKFKLLRGAWSSSPDTVGQFCFFFYSQNRNYFIYLFCFSVLLAPFFLM